MAGSLFDGLVNWSWPSPQQGALPGPPQPKGIGYSPPRQPIPMGGPPKPFDAVAGTRGMSAGEADLHGFSPSRPAAKTPFPDFLKTPQAPLSPGRASGSGPKAFPEFLKTPQPPLSSGVAAGPGTSMPPLSSSGGIGTPYGAAAQKASLGSRLGAAAGAFRSAPISSARSAAVGLGKSAAKGTVLNPWWWASQGVNLGHYGAGVEGELRGPGGPQAGSVSVGKGVSNMAHAIPGLGSVVGTGYDLTLGPMVNAASNLGDIAATGTMAALGNKGAQQAGGRMMSNLGGSLSNAWHGKSAETGNVAGPTQAETSSPVHAGTFSEYTPERIQAMDNEAIEGIRRLQGQQQDVAAAPHSGNTPAVLGGPGHESAQDPTEGMLSQRLQQAMSSQPELPFGMNGVELASPSGYLMSNINQQVQQSHSAAQQQALENLLAYRHSQNQGMATRGQNQAQILEAQAHMRQAGAAEAGDIGAMTRSPAGRHILNQQNPGLSDAMNFPDVADEPGMAALEKNPDTTVDEYMALHDMLSRNHPDSHRLGAFMRQKLLGRFGTSGLEGARTPGLFGWGAAGARKNEDFQRRIGLIP